MFGQTPDGKICLYLGNGAGGWLDGAGCSIKIDGNRPGYKLFRAGDWDGDGWNDLMVVEADGDLVYHAGNGAGSYGSAAIPVMYDERPDTPVTGWGDPEFVFSPGDFDGDQRPDLTRYGGGITYAFPQLVSGDGYGNLRDDGAARRISTLPWFTQSPGFSNFFGPGDCDGDSHPDLITQHGNGELKLRRGDGKGRFKRTDTDGDGTVSDHAALIGTGWHVFRFAYSPGDWNGDGKTDLIGIKPTGEMVAYYGNRTAPSYFAAGVQIGSGWQIYDRVF